MPSLLELPEELQDQIIEYVLLGEHFVPPNVASAKQHHGAGPRYCATRRIVLSGLVPPEANATSLLLTCRQLNQQTITSIARLFPEGVSYRLDVMIVDEHQLWPTWTSVPASTQHIRNLTVSFRILGASEYSGFTGDCGGLPGMMYAFYSLCEDILRYSVVVQDAAYANGSSEQWGRFSFKTIQMEFALGEPEHAIYEPLKGVFASTSMGPFGRLPRLPLRQPRRQNTMQGDAVGPLHPKWLAGFTSYWLSLALNSVRRTTAHGANMHEQVGNFMVKVDDEVIGEHNPGSKLASLQYREARLGIWALTQHNIDPWLAFWTWKDRAVERRRRLGFYVPVDIVWPADMQSDGQVETPATCRGV